MVHITIILVVVQRCVLAMCHVMSASRSRDVGDASYALSEVTSVVSGALDCTSTRGATDVSTGRGTLGCRPGCATLGDVAFWSWSRNSSDWRDRIASFSSVPCRWNGTAGCGFWSTSSTSASIIVRHRSTMLLALGSVWEKHYCIACAFCFCCWHVAFVVAVMVWGGANIVSSSAMFGPACTSGFDSIVDDNFAAFEGVSGVLLKS